MALAYELFNLATILLGYLTGFFLIRLTRLDIGLTLLAAWITLTLLFTYREDRLEKEALY